MPHPASEANLVVQSASADAADAADQTTGAAASIGSGKNCYKYPFPIAAQVVLSVKATKGSGPAGAQVYSK